VLIDLTGSAGQAEGPVNYYINENLIRMFFGIYMITVADPQILWNDGFYPLVDVEIPDNSFWKPEYPAALNGRNHGIGRLFDLFGGLLGQCNPDLMNGAGFSSSPHFMYSGNYSEGDRRGEWFQLYSIGFGGIPGRPVGDGPDGHSLWPSFMNIPASTSSPTTRCASSGGRRSPTAAARDCTAVATGLTCPTGSWSRAPSPSTTTGG
jgi:N-methylhydantoinase B